MSNEPAQHSINCNCEHCKTEFNYIAEALVTRSDDWYGEKVSREHLLDSLTMCIGHLKQLDRIKKTLFYGRDFVFQYDTETETIANLPNQITRCNSKKAEYIIHAIVGIATEAGELLEALQAAILGKPFDVTNIIEEQGDSFWYHAILANTCVYTFEEIQRINIAKLRARYPDKFKAFDANNRNLEKERSILEAAEPSEHYELSKRGNDWERFAEEVLHHIENYTVPQYGDKGKDQITDWSAEQCIKTAKKYLDRFGKNQRPGQEKLDLLKCAHYVQLALEKMEE